MPLSRSSLTLALAMCLSTATATRADQNIVDPTVRKILDEISEDRIRATIAHLVSFGTRHTLSSQDDPEQGIGAARKWIFAELKSYSPRLEVRYDHWLVKKHLPRVFKDADLYNVVAVLPGKTSPETEVVISAHYDSLNLGATPKPDPNAETPAAVGERPVKTDWPKSAELPAPGACDDASGVAAVMELARVMSHYEFPKTLVFIAFAGEEQGLVGSTLEAAKAKQDGQIIEAMLNNDIIGTDSSGDGATGNSEVSVYGSDAADTPSQQLARYAHTIGQRYLPFMNVNVIYMQDRLGRGGDQSPFQMEGFAAVRISTPHEILANQHHSGDTLENMSVPYSTRVAKVNAAVMASLGLAPRAPDVMNRPPEPDDDKEPDPAADPATAHKRRLPMIARGAGYDAVLRWQPAAAGSGVKGYAVVIRSTLAPFWEQEIYVGNVTTYTLKGVSIDDARFGVKAIGENGNESLVTAYVYPPRRKVEYQTAP